MDALEIGLCWGTLQHADLLELIEAAGRHGFTTLSVRPDSIMDVLNSGLDEKGLRRRLADAGVRVRVIDAISGGLPGVAPPDELDSALAGLSVGSPEYCFRAAEVVEAPIVNVCHFRGKPSPRQAMIDAIGEISRGAARRGLRVVLEFVPDTGIPDIGAAFDFAQGTGEPNCSILLDPWHLARSGGTVEDVRRLPPSAIGGFQLCDRTPPPPSTPYVPMTGRDLPGEGELPLYDLARAALANNPDLTAEIEVFSEELRGLGVEAAAARVAEATRTWRAGLT